MLDELKYKVTRKDATHLSGIKLEVFKIWKKEGLLSSLSQRESKTENNQNAIYNIVDICILISISKFKEIGFNSKSAIDISSKMKTIFISIVEYISIEEFNNRQFSYRLYAKYEYVKGEWSADILLFHKKKLRPELHENPVILINLAEIFSRAVVGMKIRDSWKF